MSKIDIKTALNDLLLSQEKRQTLVSEVKRLANDTTALKTKQDVLNDDKKAVAESLGITPKKLNEFITAYNKSLEDITGELSSTVDVLEVLLEDTNNG